MRSKLFKRYKAIAYLPTSYAILQYLLLRLYSTEDTLFLVDNICQKELIYRLPHACSFCTRPTKSRILSRIKLYWHYLILYFLSRRHSIVVLSSHPVYVDPCICYFDHVIYLEDGFSNYKVRSVKMPCKPVSRMERLKRKLTGPQFPALGWAAKVEKIYLTGILPIPAGIKDKVELINLQALWDKRSPGEKQKITHLFLSEEVASFTSQTIPVLLLTQPVSEDIGPRFTEEEKIEMYRELLSGIDERTVLIKTHPREKTDYRKYFPQATVLDTYCPMELMIIMGMKVEKAITVNSTAIYSLADSVEKVIGAARPSSKIKKMLTILWGEASITDPFTINT